MSVQAKERPFHPSKLDMPPHHTPMDTDTQTAAAPLQPHNLASLQAAGRHFSELAEIAILKIFMDYRVFDFIPDEGDIGISEVAEKIGGQQTLLERFSNLLVVTGVLASPTPGRIAHTPVSRGYKSNEAPGLIIVHLFNFLLFPAAYWPDYFEKHGLREPKNANINPLGLATGHPDRNLYGILETVPRKAELFNLTLNRMASLVSLKGIYDFAWVKDFISPPPTTTTATGIETELQDRPLIVDVGGGKGQGLKAILSDYPYIPSSRCVLVDRPDVIEENRREVNEELRSVKQVEGDMFQEQPVKGSLIYLIGRVLNDWPDDDCTRVLQHVRAACAPDSRILIVEELLLPNPSPLNLAQDIFLLNWGGKRRNARMFQELAAQAGLRVSGTFTGANSDCGVIELVPV